MHVSEGELEALVDEDAGHIRETEQGVVREDHLVPHRARMQRRLVRHRGESLAPTNLQFPQPLRITLLCSLLLQAPPVLNLIHLPSRIYFTSRPESISPPLQNPVHCLMSDVEQALTSRWSHQRRIPVSATTPVHLSVQACVHHLHQQLGLTIKTCKPRKEGMFTSQDGKGKSW